jgi:aminobenzoyl-glutamate utilization protein B
MVLKYLSSLSVFALATGLALGPAQAADLAALKQQAATRVGEMGELTQEMVDSIFSFSEPGFEESETSRYVTKILEENGFTIERGVAGMPTAWVARYGSGKPMIALGSDVDCLPSMSQKPGVAFRSQLVDGAPGHGEGHNTGIPLQVTAAIAVKEIMQREKLPGTLVIWPGIAEELLAGKAYMVRAGLFKDMDAVLFAHIAGEMSVQWGQTNSSGLISMEFSFKGRTAHAASAPWEAQSALDAVELMNAGWNFRREHLRPQQRSHYVITKGGDQPNIVPEAASVWYYLRELDYDRIVAMKETAIKIANAAAMMTDTTMSYRTLGSAWPQHMNKPIAEAVAANINTVGMPAWDEKDQEMAKAVQKIQGKKPEGMSDKVTGLVPEATNPTSGGSDDIGDVAWNVPTITLRYPANVQNMTNHHWAAAIAVATPIAHKGTTAGAKVMAMSVLDLLMRPDLVAQARDYFDNVQTKERKYQPLIEEKDQPAIAINRPMMDSYRAELKKQYYDPSKYATYLEQLGVQYPTLETKKAEGPQPSVRQ